MEPRGAPGPRSLWPQTHSWPARHCLPHHNPPPTPLAWRPGTTRARARHLQCSPVWKRSVWFKVRAPRVAPTQGALRSCSGSRHEVRPGRGRNGTVGSRRSTGHHSPPSESDRSGSRSSSSAESPSAERVSAERIVSWPRAWSRWLRVRASERRERGRRSGRPGCGSGGRAVTRGSRVALRRPLLAAAAAELG